MEATATSWRSGQGSYSGAIAAAVAIKAEDRRIAALLAASLRCAREAFILPRSSILVGCTRGCIAGIDDWKNHDRRVSRAVVNHVVRNKRVLLVVVVSASVEIAVKSRKVTARHLNTHTVARQERVARLQRTNVDLIDFSWLHEHRLVPSLAPAYTLDAFIQVICAPVRVDVHKLDRKIRILSVGRQIKRDLDGAGKFERLLQEL